MAAPAQVENLNLRRWHISDVAAAIRTGDPDLIDWVAQRVESLDQMCLTRCGMLVGTVDLSGPTPAVWLAPGFDDDVTQLEAEVLAYLEAES